MFGVEGFLGLDNVTKFPDRTALTATALAGTLAMMVASATLVEGFGAGTRRWMDEAFPFDLAITASDFITSVYTPDVLPRAMLEEVRAVPGVGRRRTACRRRSRVSKVRTSWCSRSTRPSSGRRMRAEGRASGRASSIPRWGTHSAPVRASTSPATSPTASASARAGRSRWRRRRGRRRFSVIRVVEDYSWPQGLVAMDRGRYVQLWKDEALTYVDVRAAPGTDPEDLRRRLRDQVVRDRSAFIYTVDEIKDVATNTLRQTMVFANVQVLIAIAIGFLGIVNTLMIGVLQRTREIGLLRAIGMTRRQVARTVVVEAVTIGAFGGSHRES